MYGRARRHGYACNMIEPRMLYAPCVWFDAWPRRAAMCAFHASAFHHAHDCARPAGQYSLMPVFAGMTVSRATSLVILRSAYRSWQALGFGADGGPPRDEHTRHQSQLPPSRVQLANWCIVAWVNAMQVDFLPQPHACRHMGYEGERRIRNEAD